jgi:hypothetical protein
MGIRDLLYVGLVVGGVSALAANLLPARPPAPGDRRQDRPATPAPPPPIVEEINSALRSEWAAEGLKPAARASDLAILRRLSLALTGTIPSLEEIRRFETMPPDGRTSAWLNGLLHDRRFADYFAERLARVYVGTEAGPFLLFRRRRFVSWLSDDLMANRPYDQLVRELIDGKGIWTDHPATNFLTVTNEPEKGLNADRLGARVARAFLGVRIDCAQCHDHPFQAWKQRDFQGLAAFFGQARMGLTGLYDDPKRDYQAKSRKSSVEQKIEPRVPFHPELLPTEGDRRFRLARWVTDPKNPYFARAISNRVWALMFGRPLVEPVDDLTAVETPPAVLELLANDFSTSGFNLQRLIQVIAATDAFQLDSAMSPEPTEEQEKHWAIFPLSRLRPEQVVGGVVQAASVRTIDRDTHIVVRLMTQANENNFVVRFGDTGEDEFDNRCGTIPQRLLMMNGKVVDDRTKDSLFNASAQVGQMAPDDRSAIEIAYLTVLTRRPTAEEASYFMAKLEGTRGSVRGRRMADLFWTLINSTEFSWDH